MNLPPEIKGALRYAQARDMITAEKLVRTVMAQEGARRFRDLSSGQREWLLATVIAFAYFADLEPPTVAEIEGEVTGHDC